MKEEFLEFIKNNYKRLIKISVGLAPAIISILLFIILKNPFLVLAGGCLSSTISYVWLYTIDKKQEKIIKELGLDLPFEEEDEEEFDQEDKVSLEKKKYFISELIKDAEYELGVFEFEQEEVPKIKANGSILYYPTEETVKAETKPKQLSKEVIIGRIYQEITSYYIQDDLPEMVIPDKVFDYLFDDLYEEFKNKGVESSYYSSISNMVREVIANAVIYEFEDIRITNFINYFPEFKSVGFEDTEILELIEKYKSKMREKKVLNLTKKTNN